MTLRKLSNLHMLGGKALDDSAGIRHAETGHMLRAMCESSRRGKAAVVAEMLTYSMANIIGQVILGRRVFVQAGSESNEFKDMVVELMTSAGLFNVGDFIPILAWLDLQGIESGMKRMHTKWDNLITKMVKEHSETAQERRGNPDFLDVLMATREASGLTITNIKALLLVCMSLIDLPLACSLSLSENLFIVFRLYLLFIIFLSFGIPKLYLS